MSEERTQYTVHPDVAIRLQVSEAHIKQLTSTIDGMTMVMGRHADTITAQRERIAELEAALHDTTAQLATATETIARSEADNRRLRHLDAMPLDALDRIMYDVSGDLLEEWTQVREWLDSLDGAA